MEEALVARLRANAGVIAATGSFDSRPAVDMIERRSDVTTAFPALTAQVISGGGSYDQDGASGLRQRRVRFECFALSYGEAKLLLRAVKAALDPAETVGAIRFHRSMLIFEQDMQPEDLGGQLRVFRVIADFRISTTE